MTVNLHVVDAKTFFKWAVTNDYLVRSPAIVLEEVKDQGRKRRPFDDEDVKRIFAGLQEDSEGSPARWWVPHSLLYTGMRLEEACQLHVEDVRQEGGVYVFDVNREGGKRVKTDNSERLVPVHSKLFTMGWLDYVASVGSGHLFPELTFDRWKGYSKALSRWAGRRLRRAGTTDKRKVAAHSFRHRAQSRLANAGVSPQVSDRLLGWSKDNAMRANYTLLEVQTLRDAVELLYAPLAE